MKYKKAGPSTGPCRSSRHHLPRPPHHYVNQRCGDVQRSPYDGELCDEGCGGHHHGATTLALQRLSVCRFSDVTWRTLWAAEQQRVGRATAPSHRGPALAAPFSSVRPRRRHAGGVHKIHNAGGPVDAYVESRAARSLFRDREAPVERPSVLRGWETRARPLSRYFAGPRLAQCTRSNLRKWLN